MWNHLVYAETILLILTSGTYAGEANAPSYLKKNKTKQKQTNKQKH